LSTVPDSIVGSNKLNSLRFICHSYSRQHSVYLLLVINRTVLSWDEPCLTLTTSPAQKQTERCHPDESRPFTTREYARIQTFPDDWEFQGSIGQIYRQIGNAVPVNLAYAVAEELVKSLNAHYAVSQSPLVQAELSTLHKIPA
jgi:site-specific DNA-cytosine methylase